MRLLYAIVLVALALLLVAFLLLVRPAWAAATHCTTYEERTMQRLYTVCDDGTRGISTYHKTLERWETTITESPRQSCTGRLNPITRQVEVRCR